MMKLFRFLLVTSALIAAMVGQTPTGHIKGRVTDKAQAVVPGARVEAVNTATNVTTRVESNLEGNYEVPNLIPGIYRLEIRKDGFKQYVREPIQVRVGDVLTIDASLDVGDVAESIVVNAESPMLQAATAGLDQVIDTRRIEDLPAPGNSVIYLLQTAPAITVTTAPTNLWPPDAVGSAGGTAVAGTVATSQYSMDGIPMMSRNGTFTVNPQPEMVQEFAVQVAAYDASLGRFTGAYVNMVTKSGANDLHGSLVYSNLSRGLMAHDLFTNNFINNPATGPITSAKIDQAWPPQRDIRLRGNIGGPVYLPKLYNGRNKTFWIFGGDGVIRQRASRSSYTVPTLEQRDGDFSQLLRLGSQYQIYDPATIQPAANGRFTRQPFPGNIIPASRLNANAKQILNYYPLPNQPGNTDGTNNYSDPNMADSPYIGFLGRVDHSFSDTHRLFFAFNNTSATPLSNNYFHNPSTGT
ncbi:MAG TPA: carboxypeptidase-like regulatory domain-containing protein, partial [Bryobacteraceae bacterium]|nr:carboxypeptidase-like regulatory domain-containing protein [Bryobacteraceae bacterium]